MSAKEIFRRIVDALEQAGIPYMLTGSFASSLHGAQALRLSHPG